MKRCWPALIALICVFAGCAAPRKAELTLFAMDTYCTIEAHGERAEAAAEAARAELMRLEELFSISRPESDVYRVNASDGELVTVSADTAALLTAANAVSEATEGAFDVTIEPAVRLWGFYDDTQRVPDEAELAEALARMSYQRLSLTGALLQTGPGQSVDFGGIAKGYASARMAEIFASYGVESAMISLGGNVQTVGGRPGGGAWRIGVRDPRDEAAVLGVVEASDCAVVTAGSYQRYFEADGMRYHHILDPATGKPAQSGLLSVTVITEDGARADALSTALFVMGADMAEAFWRSRMDFGMLLVTEGGELRYTENIVFTPGDNGYKLSEIVE